MHGAGVDGAGDVVVVHRGLIRPIRLIGPITRFSMEFVRTLPDMLTIFRDRTQAGELLAERLRAYEKHPGAIVLALPRGGVPVGFEIANKLGLPLDVFVVRKLGVPGQRELAMGAIASGGVRVINDDVIRTLRIPLSTVQAVAMHEQSELERQ